MRRDTKRSFRNLLQWSFIAAFIVNLPVPSFGAESVIQSGVPFSTSLEAGEYANACITVPEGATKLTVTLTKGSGDLDLYVKYGSPLTGPTVSALDADTDFISDDDTPGETIVVTPASTPPLRAGRWYIATFNWNTTTTCFTVTATAETPVAVIKHELTLSTSSEVTIPGSGFGCTYTVKKGSDDDRVDFYAVIAVNNILFFFSPSGLTLNPEPYQRDIPVTDFSGTLLPQITLPGKMPKDQYFFGALLVKSGGSLANANNWVSNLAIASMTLMGLSPTQAAFVRDLGYPLQFTKTFSQGSNGAQRVDETWIYLSRGLGENFINGVFTFEKQLENSLPDAPPGSFHPEHYSFDTTFDDVRALHGEPLETYKDAMAGGYYKTYLYDGIIFGFLDDSLVAVIAGK